MEEMTQLIEEVEMTLAPYFKEIENNALINQEKCLTPFIMSKRQKVIFKDPRDMDMMTLEGTI